MCGVLLGGSSGRGEVWPGSDVDLFVVAARDTPVAVGRPDVGARFADMHPIPAAELEALTIDRAAFAAASVVDETAGGLPLYDPRGILARWLALVQARLDDSAMWRARAEARLLAARAALAAAAAEPEPIESALLARDAARLGAWAAVVGRGGLVGSARRFAGRFLAECSEGMRPPFAHAWGLGGGQAAVEVSIGGLRAALRAALDGAARQSVVVVEHPWIATWRAGGAAEREAFIARHPWPPLLAPAMASGHHDGVLMWMRGYYRPAFKEVLSRLPPAEWPVAELRQFYGLLGGERAACGILLAQVAKVVVA